MDFIDTCNLSLLTQDVATIPIGTWRHQLSGNMWSISNQIIIIIFLLGQSLTDQYISYLCKQSSVL